VKNTSASLSSVILASVTLTVVVVVDWLLRVTAVDPLVDLVESVIADVTRYGPEMTIDAERVTLAVEVRQSQNSGHQPRRRDHLYRPRLAREDLGVNRMYHRVKPVSIPVASMRGQLHVQEF